MLVAAHNAAIGELVAAHSAIVTVDAGGGSWMLLVPAGETTGRDGRGPYRAGDAAAMQSIVTATKARQGAVDVMVDYDHQSLFSAVPGVGGRAPAAGWITDYKIETDGIHGHVQWTETAAQAIRDREYRYISPVFTHDTEGKVLFLVSAGLVNVPNFDLAAVAASADLNRTTGGTMLKTIAKALGLAETATEAEILTAINAAQTERSNIAKAAGLSGDVAATAIITAVQSAAAGAKPDPTKFVPIEQVTAMQAQVNLLVAKDADKDAETAVQSAIQGGKLSPALKDWGLALHKADPAQFTAFVDKAPVLTAPQRDLGKRVSAEPTLGESDLAVARAMGIDEATFLAARKQEAA